jgi:ferredoxin-NADP reductase
MNGTLERLSASWVQTRRTATQRLFWDRQAEFWRRELVSLGLRSRTHARLVDVIDETADTRTLVLDPPRAWRRHRAGQWVTVDVELDGVRTRRCYSISSAPHAPYVHLTVKRVPAGRVSNFLHALEVGALLELGLPEGDFVLPEPTPPRLLFVSGGSGVTPILSMLHDLEQRGAIGDVVVVHHARRRDDVIFGDALVALAMRHPSLRVELCLDDDPHGPGGFDEARLRALVPDLAERETFLCGPPVVMARVEAMWRDAGISERLHAERFAAPSVAAAGVAAAGEGADVIVTFGGRPLAARTEGTLLDQLEQAGERPPSGCRMGICHSCTCLKRSGRVRHAITGAISDAPDELVQLCVSVPCSDVELEPRR